MRTALALGAALLLAAAPSDAAAAETAAPPSHLTAYNLDWLNYVDPADIPATRHAVCFVDTGVAVTPDTPPDDPVHGPILARVAGDGGSGLPFDTSSDQLHGTRMAMAAAAPQNNWGTIGTATWVPVISVRATRDGEATFRGEAYAGGISQCLKIAGDLGTKLAAINFSLACTAPCELTDEDRRLLDNRIAQAQRQFDVSVVAAAGNVAGSGVGVPAAQPGMFAVAAGDRAGALCASGSFDPRVAVIGPACPVDLADPVSGVPASGDGGASSATAVSATLLAALRTLRPQATYDEAEAWLRSTARTTAGRPVLDGEAAARAAGLGAVVGRAQARVPAPTATATPSPTASPAPTTAPPPRDSTWRRLPRPRVRSVRWRNDALQVELDREGCRERLELHAFGAGRRSKRLATGRRLTLRLAFRPARIILRCVPADEFSELRPSRPLVLKRIGGRYRP